MPYYSTKTENRLAIYSAIAIVAFWAMVIASTIHAKTLPIVSYAGVQGIEQLCNNPIQVYACYNPVSNIIYMNFALIGSRIYPNVYWHEMGHAVYGFNEKQADEYAELMTNKQ